MNIIKAIEEGIEKFKKDCPEEFKKVGEESEYQRYTDSFSIGFDSVGFDSIGFEKDLSKLSEEWSQELGKAITSEVSDSLMRALAKIDIGTKLDSPDFAHSAKMIEKLVNDARSHEGIIVSPVGLSLLQSDPEERFSQANVEGFTVTSLFKAGNLVQGKHNTNVYCGILTQDIIPFNEGEIFYKISDPIPTENPGMFGVEFEVYYK